MFVRWNSEIIQNDCIKFKLEYIHGGEVQSPLNQKLNSKFLRAVDFTSRFILSIKFKLKTHTFNSYYESRCKINSSKILNPKILNPIFNSKGFEPPPPPNTLPT
jgi:hypothetical protein